MNRLFAKLYSWEVTDFPNYKDLPFAKSTFSPIVIYLNIWAATVTIYESLINESDSSDMYSRSEPTEL